MIFPTGFFGRTSRKQDAARAFVAGEPGLVKVVDLLFGQGGLPDGPVAHLPGGIDTIYKYLYTSLVSDKSILWVGSSLDDVRSFPVDARRLAGHFLHLVQQGLEPPDWKPMASIAPFRRKHELRQRVISIWHGDD
jgi:hypothetical protein